MITLPKRCLLERTPDAKDLPIPTRQTKQAAGVDLYAKISEAVTMQKGECVLIPTGIKIALPFGYEAQIRSRSGLALNHGVVVLNSPGTIDPDYRGEIKVLLINHGMENFTINRGDRIAQMVFAKVEMMTFNEVDTLPETQRDSGGFGSTGIKQ
ncbi:MAG: dUTP diphosphatase [Defluviitaleaceae bacterium]|nr:dUTP diphosphatase [Defluviitaleaceae bacterium]MCL2263451.1 dUTP diphosphatase [Defluviitaleaceae bacterium]